MFIKVPARRVFNLDSKMALKSRFMREKAMIVQSLLDSLLNTVTEHGKDLTHLVLDRVASTYDLTVQKKDYTVTLDIQEVITLRDTVDCGTNAIYRLATCLGALHPDVELLPRCLKARNAKFEGQHILCLQIKLHS